LASYRDDTLLLGEADDCKIALGASCSWINDDVYHLSPNERHDGGVHERFNIAGPEALLQGVKRKSGELRLNEIWSIRHNCLQSFMTNAALPLWYQMKHVFALSC
jgi:hypothetical protein